MVKYPNGDVAIDWGTNETNKTWQPTVQAAHWTGQKALTSQVKYMFSRLRDKYNVLEDQILDIGNIIADELKIEEWQPNNKLQSETFRTIGRICCDATSGARLNASSLLLEGDRDISSGQSVPLDVSQVKDYSFFPGQIVALEGSNPTGKKVVVSAVKTPPLGPTPKTDVDLDGPLNVMVACGPFTLSDDLDFAPLSDLISRIQAVRPHLVILMGPFLDARNKKIESGDLERTYQEEFDFHFDKLQRFIPNTVQVVIIPSWRDIHHRTIYPTPSFEMKPASKVQPNFHFFSDPCVINVNGVFIALTSTDILFHLSKEEIAVTPHGSDRMSRLVSHLFSQRSFYPLNPAAEEMSVDLEQVDEYCKLPFIPHVLIVPSDLRHFIKNVHGCVVVNTERTVKGFSGGTYARLQITGEASSVQVKAEVVRI
nr:EOG090X07VJ [Eurycercus lamellatus]